EERQPSCVSTCPAGARHFGDLGDENSDVSKLVAERNGFDLMPELGYQPTNKYLPPRPKSGPSSSYRPLNIDREETIDSRFLKWVDRLFSR
ncbi:MAG: hypothetical protein KUG52_06430, partial [Immundisolibacteraceae bacterium]|nr:hypothetical protein [Immundisolibacteraceae bacterium]